MQLSGRQLSAVRSARSTVASRVTLPRQSRRQRALVVHNMFTGIVQGLAAVAHVNEADSFKSFKIQFPPGKADGVQIGASVAINGTCLTVTAIEQDVLSFDVMSETLRATSLGALKAGSKVNFERSARVGDEIGGHNVSGHVHCTARIVDVQESENNKRITFELPDDKWMKYVLPKGFISVDGCSLTVGEVEGQRFSVYLIPETLRVTVFGFKGLGDSVNIEIEAQTQAIVDTVERVVAQYLDRGVLKPGGSGSSSVQQLAGAAATAAAAAQGRAAADDDVSVYSRPISDYVWQLYLVWLVCVFVYLLFV